MSDNDERNLTADDIKDAISEAIKGKNTIAFLFTIPAFVGFATLLLLAVLGFIAFIGNTENAEMILQFLSSLLP